jgi:hypothetical protein
VEAKQLDEGIVDTFVSVSAPTGHWHSLRNGFVAMETDAQSFGFS